VQCTFPSLEICVDICLMFSHKREDGVKKQRRTQEMASICLHRFPGLNSKSFRCGDDLEIRFFYNLMDYLVIQIILCTMSYLSRTYISDF